MLKCHIEENINLNLLELQDNESLFNEVDHSRIYLRKWLPWVDQTQSAVDSKHFIQAVLNQYLINQGFQAGIWYKERLIGVIGYHWINWSHKYTSIGYWLGQDFQGRGIMTKACHAFVDYAFTDLNLNRVEIRCAQENHQSRAIPKRLGFQNEGCLRDGEWLYDHFVDLVVYGMLRREWDTLGGSEDFNR